MTTNDTDIFEILPDSKGKSLKVDLAMTLLARDVHFEGSWDNMLAFFLEKNPEFYNDIKQDILPMKIFEDNCGEDLYDYAPKESRNIVEQSKEYMIQIRTIVDGFDINEPHSDEEFADYHCMKLAVDLHGNSPETLEKTAMSIAEYGNAAIPNLASFANDEYYRFPFSPGMALLPMSAIAILGCIGTTEAAAALIPILIEEDDSPVFSEAMETIIDIGEPAIEPLVSLLNEAIEKNTYDESHADIAIILAAIGDDPRIYDIAFRLIEKREFHASDELIFDAVNMLDTCDDARTADAIEELLNDPKLSDELKSQIADIREEMLEGDTIE